MHICFIYPSYVRHAEANPEIREVVSAGSYLGSPTMSIALLAGCTPSRHEVSFIDDRIEEICPTTAMSDAGKSTAAAVVATAARHDSGPIAFRYPRGEGTGIEMPERGTPLEIGRGRIMQEGADVAILIPNCPICHQTLCLLPPPPFPLILLVREPYLAVANPCSPPCLQTRREIESVLEYHPFGSPWPCWPLAASKTCQNARASAFVCASVCLRLSICSCVCLRSCVFPCSHVHVYVQLCDNTHCVCTSPKSEPR